MKKLLTGVLFFGLLFVASPAYAASLPGAGITPGSPFFFLDRVGEWVDNVLAFSAQSKARVSAAHAAERVAEVQALIAAKGADAPGLDRALAMLGKHKTAAAAAALKVKNEQARRELTKEVADNFGEIEHELDSALVAQAKLLRDQYRTEQKSLLEQYVAAMKEKNKTEAEQIKQQIEQKKEALKTQLEILKQKTEVSDDLDSVDEDLEDELSDEDKSEIRKEDAERAAELERESLEAEQENVRELMKQEQEAANELSNRDQEFQREQLKKLQEQQRELQKRAKEAEREALKRRSED